MMRGPDMFRSGGNGGNCGCWWERELLLRNFTNAENFQIFVWEEAFTGEIFGRGKRNRCEQTEQ